MEMADNSLCNSCINFGCEFQSGIVRTECAFYMPPPPIGEELRKFREGITDEKVLIGFNMAIAICNKYFGKREDKE